MILGIGIDIVELERIAHVYDRFGKVFLKKLLAPVEFTQMPERIIPWLGGRFAAKEAASKALGTGFSQGITLCDLEILTLPSGRPQISFLACARAKADALGVRHAHISISHERRFAVAEVILED